MPRRPETPLSILKPSPEVLQPFIIACRRPEVIIYWQQLLSNFYADFHLGPFETIGTNPEESILGERIEEPAGSKTGQAVRFKLESVKQYSAPWVQAHLAKIDGILDKPADEIGETLFENHIIEIKDLSQVLRGTKEESRRQRLQEVVTNKDRGKVLESIIFASDVMTIIDGQEAHRLVRGSVPFDKLEEKAQLKVQKELQARYRTPRKVEWRVKFGSNCGPEMNMTEDLIIKGNFPALDLETLAEYFAPDTGPGLKLVEFANDHQIPLTISCESHPKEVPLPAKDAETLLVMKAPMNTLLLSLLLDAQLRQINTLKKADHGKVFLAPALVALSQLAG